MPMGANSPEEVYELFTRHFSAGNLEAILSLYEPGATMLPMGAPQVIGLEGLRRAFTEFLAPKPKLDLKIKKVIQTGDLALVLAAWTLKETDPDSGEPIERAGQTSDVVRRQPDGTWRLVIDVPYGAAVVQE
jgi:uncharacterized protein (TIGR02246 family)